MKSMRLSRVERVWVGVVRKEGEEVRGLLWVKYGPFFLGGGVYCGKILVWETVALYCSL